MKRIAVLTLVITLTAGLALPIEARSTSVPKNDRQSDKSTQKKQNALYEYQKKQERAQQKAQRKADKQQKKAAKNYEKQQRKQLKNSNYPTRHTP